MAPGRRMGDAVSNLAPFEPLDRRRFLQVIGSLAALGGVSLLVACQGQGQPSPAPPPPALPPGAAPSAAPAASPAAVTSPAAASPVPAASPSPAAAGAALAG